LPTPPGGGAGIWDFTQTPDGTVWAGGDFAGAGATSASVAAIINAGRAATYPVLRMRNLSNSGTARVYQVVKTTTNAGDLLQSVAAARRAGGADHAAGESGLCIELSRQYSEFDYTWK
jgi:hypothetical protein